MDVQTDRWRESSLPALNVARSSHASLGLGQQCYVACGCGNSDNWLRSVEMLRMGAQAWELIEIPELTVRGSPIFAQIDFNNICILGGKDEDG